MTTTTTPRVLVCGLGNASHAFCGLFSAAGVPVRLFESLGQSEVDRFLASFKENNSMLEVSMLDGSIRKGAPELVTCDPQEAADGLTSSDIIMMPLPSFAIPLVIRKLGKYLPKGITVGALPGQGGLDWEVHAALKEIGRSDIVLFGTNTLPFACRVTQFGAKVDCPGMKRELSIATSPPSAVGATAELLTSLFANITMKLPGVDGKDGGEFSTVFRSNANFLSISIQPANQIVHPGIMRALCQKQESYTEAPDFYWSLDQNTEQELLRLESEIFDVARALDKIKPELQIENNITTVLELLLNSYSDSVPLESQGRLLTTFTTNAVYKGMKAPMKPVAENSSLLVPNTESRYLTEDVPDSLVLLRGIADLCNVATPRIDELIIWSQAQLGKEYLVQHEGSSAWKLEGADLGSSRAPQRYGINTIEELIALY